MFGKAGMCTLIVAVLSASGCGERARPPRTVSSTRELELRLRVPPGFRAKEGTTKQPHTSTGWTKEIIHERIGIEMVFIPAGEFLMGTHRDDRYWNDDEVQHLVRITKPFYIGRYEVTQGEWRKLMGADLVRPEGNDRLPVTCVSWDTCQQFLKRAADGLKLPTEAQWEYACRAGSKTLWCFGDEASELTEYAWCWRNGGRSRHEVGLKKPNAWELYDMVGNVAEWCGDWLGKYQRPETGALSDPSGPDRGEARVLRGGGWNAGPINCRSSRRDGELPSAGGGTVGFRVVLNLEEP